MNHLQIEKNGMFKKMLIFFANEANSNIWSGFKRLVDEIIHFIALNASLTNFMQQHQTDTKGITKAKNEAFLTMVNLVVNKAQRAYVWALDTANERLQQIFDIQKSDFTTGMEVHAFNKIKIVRDELSTNMVAMESVQLAQADVDALNEAIAAYEATFGTTGAARAHKTGGTKGIEDIIQSIDSSLDIIDKLITSTYSESHATMVKEYLINRTPEKLPTHHSGISTHVTDAATGADLEGAVLTLNGKSTTSDIDGAAEIIKMKPGTYHATVSMEGYVPQTVKIVIKRGKVSTWDAEMVKAG